MRPKYINDIVFWRRCLTGGERGLQLGRCRDGCFGCKRDRAQRPDASCPPPPAMSKGACVMRVITICQPHAWGVVHGTKRLENRGWPSSYAGPLLIHAGKSRKYLGDRSSMERAYPGLPPFGGLAFWAIIGMVQMCGSVPLYAVADAPYAEGPWCHVYEDTCAIGPVPCVGALGFWTPSPGVRVEVRDLLAIARAATPLRRA
jgi:hypothetical protein